MRNIDKHKLLKMSNNDVKKLLEEKGSVFVSEIDKDKILVQHIYWDEEGITSLEYSPDEQFEKISSNIWYREYVLPNIENTCFWLYKNCQAYNDEERDEQQRNERLVNDKYCKNNLHIYDNNGNVVFDYKFIKPVKQEVEYGNLKSEEIKFYSEMLKDEREIIVVYPKNYDPKIQYTCLLISDGNIWKNSLFLDKYIAKLVDLKLGEEFIICFIIQKDRNVELPMNKQYCSFVANELTHLLASKGLVFENKDNFIFFGSSFGGLTGLYLDMYFSDKIGTIISQSASLWYDKNDEIIRHYEKNLIKTKLYYSYGNCEKKFITEKGKLFECFLKSVLDSKFTIFGGGHDYISWRADLGNALEWISKKSQLNKL